MNNEHDTHIASFVVQHRADALATLRAFIDASDDLELAVPGDVRSVVLVESADRNGVMDRVDQLQALPGVLNVLLVYHHAEPDSALALPLDSPVVTGVPA